MRHLQYDAHGRTYALDTGQRMWVGGVGQEQIATPQGFQPYRWDATTKRIDVAHLGLQFGADGWSLHNGRKLIDAAFFVEKMGAGGRWRRTTPTVSDLRIQVVPGLATDKIEAAYTLGLPDGEADILFRLGGQAVGVSSFILRANREGEYRVALRTDYGGAIKPVPAFVRGKNGRVGAPAVRYHLTDVGLQWGWLPEERVDHVIESVAGAFQLGIGASALRVGEERRISPDTWGATGIAAEADDGAYNAAGNWATNGQYGDGKHYVEIGQLAPCVYRWVPNIGVASGIASIDSGTQIVWTNHGDNSGPTSTGWELSAIETANLASWPATLSGLTDWTEAAYTGFGDANATKTQAVTTIVAELVTTNGYDYTGSAGMGFFLEENGGSGYWGVSYDTGTGTVATLAIVYTLAGGGAVHYDVTTLTIGSTVG